MLNELMKEIHDNAVEHGWWDKDFTEEEITCVWAKLSATPGLRDRVIEKLKQERSIGDIIALCHSELSEALEEHRNGHIPSEAYYSCPLSFGDYLSHCGSTEKTCNNICGKAKPEGIPSELADVIIRILDFCGHEGIDIDEAIRIKHEYNKTRPYKHGGKKL